MSELRIGYQRYYHVVVFGKKVPWSLNTLWKALDATESTSFADVQAEWGCVQFRDVRTSYPLAPPSNDEDRAPRKDGAGNFVHDVFAVEVIRGAERHVALGVPYLRLGHMFGNRLRQARLLSRADFVKADPEALVSAVRQGAAADVGVSVSKVQVRIHGLSVKGFSLSADNAVLSPLYKQITGHVRRAELLKVRAKDIDSSKTGMSFSNCTVRQLNAEDGALSIHCDRHGNFTVWVQRNGRNLPMLRHWLAALRTLKASSLIGDYPLYRKHFESGPEA